MNLTPNQASAIAAVRLLWETGEHGIATKLASMLIDSPLFEDEPIHASLDMMLGSPV